MMKHTIRDQRIKGGYEGYRLRDVRTKENLSKETKELQTTTVPQLKSRLQDREAQRP